MPRHVAAVSESDAPSCATPAWRKKAAGEAPAALSLATFAAGVEIDDVGANHGHPRLAGVRRGSHLPSVLVWQSARLQGRAKPAVAYTLAGPQRDVAGAAVRLCFEQHRRPGAVQRDKPDLHREVFLEAGADDDHAGCP